MISSEQHEWLTKVLKIDIQVAEAPEAKKHKEVDANANPHGFVSKELGERYQGEHEKLGWRVEEGMNSLPGIIAKHERTLKIIEERREYLEGRLKEKNETLAAGVDDDALQQKLDDDVEQINRALNKLNSDHAKFSEDHKKASAALAEFQDPVKRKEREESSSTVTRKFTEEEKESRKLEVGPDGQLKQGGQEIIDYTNVFQDQIRETSERGFVVDPQTGDLHGFTPGRDNQTVQRKNEEGEVVGQQRQIAHHSSPLGGEDVAGAGEMLFKRGKLIEVSNKSGHYRPHLVQMIQTVEQLTRLGVGLTTDLADADGNSLSDKAKEAVYRMESDKIKIGEIQKEMDWALKQLERSTSERITEMMEQRLEGLSADFEKINVKLPKLIKALEKMGIAPAHRFDENLRVRFLSGLEGKLGSEVHETEGDVYSLEEFMTAGGREAEKARKDMVLEELKAIGLGDENVGFEEAFSEVIDEETKQLRDEVETDVDPELVNQRFVAVTERIDKNPTLLSQGSGDSGRIRAVLIFLQGKLELGDYGSALKSLITLEALLDAAEDGQGMERREATTTIAEGEVEAGPTIEQVMEDYEAPLEDHNQEEESEEEEEQQEDNAQEQPRFADNEELRAAGYEVDDEDFPPPQPDQSDNEGGGVGMSDEELAAAGYRVDTDDDIPQPNQPENEGDGLAGTTDEELAAAGYRVDDFEEQDQGQPSEGYAQSPYDDPYNNADLEDEQQPQGGGVGGVSEEELQAAGYEVDDDILEPNQAENQGGGMGGMTDEELAAAGYRVDADGDIPQPNQPDNEGDGLAGMTDEELAAAGYRVDDFEEQDQEQPNEGYAQSPYDDPYNNADLGNEQEPQGGGVGGVSEEELQAAGYEVDDEMLEPNQSDNQGGGVGSVSEEELQAAGYEVGTDEDFSARPQQD